jgi:hypothetical protein
MTDNRVSTSTEAEYNLVGVREDLEDMIYRVSPYDTPLVSAIGKLKATQELHEWQTQALRAASNSNAAQDGAKAAVVARTETTRLGNRCQIFTDVMSITGRAQKAEKAGRKDQIAYQKLLAGLALKTDIEKTALTNQAKVTGAAGTAPLLAGLQTWIATNVNKASDGTNPTGNGSDTRTAGTARALKESFLTDVLQQVWSNSNQPPSMLLVPGKDKPVISGFGANSTRLVDADSKKLYAGVDIYFGDFSDVKITPDRFLPDNTCVYALNPEFLGMAWFRPMQTWMLSIQGDSQEWELLADVTLEVKNPTAHGVIADLS